MGGCRGGGVGDGVKQIMKLSAATGGVWADGFRDKAHTKPDLQYRELGSPSVLVDYQINMFGEGGGWKKGEKEGGGAPLNKVILVYIFCPECHANISHI